MASNKGTVNKGTMKRSNSDSPDDTALLKRKQSRPTFMEPEPTPAKDTFNYLSFLEFANNNYANLNDIDEIDIATVRLGKQNYDLSLVQKFIFAYIYKHKLSNLRKPSSSIKYDEDLWRLFLIDPFVIIYVKDLEIYCHRVFNVISE